MVEFLDMSVQALFEESVSRGITEGVSNEEAYVELVSNVIADHRRLGELADDNDLEGMEDVLSARWAEFEARLTKKNN